MMDNRCKSGFSAITLLVLVAIATLSSIIYLATYKLHDKTLPENPIQNRAVNPSRIQPNENTVITLERTECFGICPAYKLTITGTGLVTYEGKNHVAYKGIYNSKLTDEELEELFFHLSSVDLLSFKDEYTENITDMPTTYVSVTHNGVTKTIKDYFGAPPELRELESRIDFITRSYQWIKDIEEIKKMRPLNDIAIPFPTQWTSETLGPMTYEYPANWSTTSYNDVTYLHSDYRDTFSTSPHTLGYQIRIKDFKGKNIVTYIKEGGLDFLGSMKDFYTYQPAELDKIKLRAVDLSGTLDTYMLDGLVEGMGHRIMTVNEGDWWGVFALVPYNSSLEDGYHAQENHREVLEHIVRSVSPILTSQ